VKTTSHRIFDPLALWHSLYTLCRNTLQYYETRQRERG
jgi:hypothetical protein